MILFIDGVSVNNPFTFFNGFTISKLKDIPDAVISNGNPGYIRNYESYVLYKSVEEEDYKIELFEQGVFTTEIISLNLRGIIGVEVLAASDYCTWNVPNIINYGITQRLEVTDLTSINENIKKLSERTTKEKSCIEVALMYLNKSKICIKRVNGNYEHAIFFRIALENCFDAPKEKKEATVAQRATILLDQFDSSEVKQKFKRIYSQTSVAVHSGKVPKAPKDNSTERKVKIGDYYMYDILVMSISKIIKNGFPNW